MMTMAEGGRLMANHVVSVSVSVSVFYISGRLGPKDTASVYSSPLVVCYLNFLRINGSPTLRYHSILTTLSKSIV